MGEKVWQGKAAILEQLPPYLTSLSAKKTALISKAKIQTAPDLVTKEWQSLSLVAVILSGLIDGVNPCVFLVLAMLLSSLTILKDTSAQSLWRVAFSFTIAIFLTYLSIGLGLWQVLYQLASFEAISRYFAYSLAGVVAFLGILHFYDFLVLQKYLPGSLILQFSEPYQQKIQKIISQKLAQNTLGAAGAIGFLVALLEFPCTGQVYLPIILILRHLSSQWFQAFGYLLIYNFMFILPLIIIFALLIKGITLKQIQNFFVEQKATTKLLLTGLYLSLAIIIISLKI